MLLSKHHGLGNDFLVVLDAAGDTPVTADDARALCDRHTGLGADGIIRALPGPAASVPARGRGDGAAGTVVAVMELTNADGSRAEMSGNGIRCLAQALVLAGWTSEERIPIGTDAGLRTVQLVDRLDLRTHSFSVDMGAVRLVAEAPEWRVPGVARAAVVDVGNPHLVLALADEGTAAEPDLVELGELANAEVPGGANVHLLRAAGTGAVAIRTHERGVGPTLACGTGAYASVAAARHWGMVGDAARVMMPGGAVDVTLRSPTDGSGDLVAALTGPATFVARIDTAVERAVVPGSTTVGERGTDREGEEAPCR